MTDNENAAPSDAPSPLAEAELYERLKGWFLEDRRAQSEWYKDAERGLRSTLAATVATQIDGAYSERRRCRLQRGNHL